MLTFQFPDLNRASEFSSGTKHEQLHNLIRAEIQDGRIKPESRLPSECDLAKKLGIARNTVRQTMASLEKEGLILRIHGKGTYVHKQARERFRPISSGLYAFLGSETEQGLNSLLLNGFCEAAERNFHQVIVCDTENEPFRQGNSILNLIDRNVSGVVIQPMKCPNTPLFQVRQLQRHNIPVVFYSQGIDGIHAPQVQIPFEQVGQLAAQSVIDAGHREIALVLSQSTHDTRAFESGFRSVTRLRSMSNSIKLQVFYNESSSSLTDTNIDAIDLILAESVRDLRQPVTAIVTDSDFLAEDLYVKLIRSGHRVPEEISLIGFGASIRTSPFLKQLTSVTIDETQLANQILLYFDRMCLGEISIECADSISASITLHPGGFLWPLSR